MRLMSDGGTLRASRPDAIDARFFYLVKNVNQLRLTGQIRLLTFMAIENHRKLRLVIPPMCQLSSDLEAFVFAHAKSVVVDRNL